MAGEETEHGVSGRAGVASARGAATSESARGPQVIECSVRVGGVDFVLVPAARRVGRVELGTRSASGVNATTRRLWEARQQARLTQAQLAKRLGCSQAMVSQAESGRDRVSERYVNKVLEACQLQAGWGLPQASSEEASGWDLDPKDIAGLDPETLVPVRRGSERDLVLRRTLVWWEGFEDET
jgi:transcriptional regulator with XRE-family HTH domain